MEKIVENLNKIEKLIGNTPLVEITYSYKEEVQKVYAKLEYYNISGSVKDRMAYYILKKSYEKGLIKRVTL